MISSQGACNQYTSRCWHSPIQKKTKQIRFYFLHFFVLTRIIIKSLDKKFSLCCMSKKSWPILCSNLLYNVGQDFLNILYSTIRPRSLDPFHVVTYYKKWVKTSWTYIICTTEQISPPYHVWLEHNLRNIASREKILNLGMG